MEQLEIISWQTLDAIKGHAKIVEVVGDLEAEEHMSVFCYIEDDYIELFYSELDANFIRHFEDEDEFYKTLENRKNEFGEEDFDPRNFYEEDENFVEEEEGDEMDGFDIKDEDDDDEY
ncbi:MAG TPA: hypothetical protein PKK12_00555 [Candidatus Aminicenantes bacterium]|nr:hypothetical protein [Candidatus Aminicenantes bacterium]